MGVDQIVVAATLIAMMGALMARRVSPTLGVVGALMFLFIVGIADATTTFAGFSNPAPLTIAALYVVAGAVQRTGALSMLVTRLAGDRTFGRVLFGSAMASAFVANTPVVAILIGPVVRWANERRLSASKLLIPLSYATILGGMTTIIGTSTNLIGSGVMVSLGLEPLSFFEPARFGLPVAIVGLLLAVFLGGRLLPPRLDPDPLMAPEKNFTISCTVTPDGPLDGSSVTDAGLRDLPGLFLVAARKPDSGEVLAPVDPEHTLTGGEVLSFAGSVDEVVGLHHRPGLLLAEEAQLDALSDGQHAWFEAVVGNGSHLIGRTLKQADFRSRYQAAVVALHRSGRPLSGKLGDERLRLGDSLLLVADLGFARRFSKRGDFLLVRRRSEPPPTATAKASLSLAILGLVVLLSITQATDVLRAAAIGAALTVATGILSPRQARDAVDLSVVLLIGCAIGIGGIATETGLAAEIANGLVSVLEPIGPWGVAVGLTLAALVLTELVTNAAAVAITLPIAVASAAQVGGDERLFALGAIVAASASFLTPVGYQTNTMVYGPGRYHFTDYLRLGLPITAVVLLMVPLMMVM